MYFKFRIRLSYLRFGRTAAPKKRSSILPELAAEDIVDAFPDDLEDLTEFERCKEVGVLIEAVVETEALTTGEAQPADPSRVRGTETIDKGVDTEAFVGEVQLRVTSCVRGMESSDVAGEDTNDISVNEETEPLSDMPNSHLQKA